MNKIFLAGLLACCLCAAFCALPEPGHAARSSYGARTGSAGGVGGLGYGRPAPPPPPREAPPSSYPGATRQDYARGYMGNSPNDPWHRDSDFHSRNWLLKNGQPERFARPPASVSRERPGPDVTRTPSLVIPRLPSPGSLPQDSSDISGLRERDVPASRPGARSPARRPLHGTGAYYERLGDGPLGGR